MEDIRLFQEFNDSDFLDGLKKIETQLNAIDESAKSVSVSHKDYVEKTNKVVGDQHKLLGDSVSKLTEMASQYKVVDSAQASFYGKMKESVLGANLFGKSIGEWKTQIGGYLASAKSTIVATEGMTIAQKALNLIMKASPIGLLLSAVLALIGAFQSMQGIVDFVARAWASASSVVSVLVDRIFAAGRAIFDLYKGMALIAKAGFEITTLQWGKAMVTTTQAMDSFKKSAIEGKEAISGLGTALLDAAKNAYEAQQRLQDLRDYVLSTTVNYANMSKEVEKLKSVRDDENVSFKKRIQAAKDAMLVEQALVDDMLASAKEELSATKQLHQGHQLTIEDKKQESDLVKTIIDLDVQRSKIASDTSKAIMDIRKKESSERKRAMDEEKKRQEEINKLVDEYNKLRAAVILEAKKADAEGLDRFEKLTAKLLIDIDAINKRIAEAKEKAVRAGLTFDLEKEFDSIVTSVERDFSDAVKSLEDKLNKGVKINSKIPKLVQDSLTEALSFSVFKTGFVVPNEFVEYVNGIDPALAEIVTEQLALDNTAQAIEKTIELGKNLTTEIIKKKFGKKEWALIKEGLSKTLSSLFDGIDTFADLKIEKIDRLIEKIDAQINKQKELVDSEKEAKEKGLANNYELEKSNLDRLSKLREDQEAKRQKIERQAAARQLLIDSAQQASSLATGAANVLKAESNKGLLGILFAFGAIATLFSLFARAKALSKSSVEIPKYAEGGEIDDDGFVYGNSHVNNGVKFATKKGNAVELEGGEHVTRKSVAVENKQFLKKFNAGVYSGLSLETVLDTILAGNQATDSVESYQNSVSESMAYKIVEASKTGADKIVNAINSKPLIAPKGGHKEITYTQSGKITKNYD